MKFRLKEDLGYNRALATKWGQATTGLKYLATRKGPLATGSFDVLAFAKTSPDEDRVDGQVLLGPWTIPAVSAGEPVAVEREPGLSCLGLVLRPTSEGSVAITSADPDAVIRVEPNYFTTDHDRRTGAKLLRRMRDILSQSPIADRISHETYPGENVHTDDELVDSALEGGYCGYHAIGTCAMGPSDEDVVDSKLRVRGIDGLRVIDCSVMPTMVAGNLNGPIMAMASRAAEFIRDEQ